MPGYVLVTGPAEEPVSLDEAKQQCRVDFTDDDALLNGLIIAARQYVENAGNLCLITQTWRYEDFGFPCEHWEPIRISKAPVQSITSIKYRDENDALVTLDPSLYRLDNTDRGCFVWPPPNNYWPWPLPRFWNGPEVAALQVTFVAGFGDAEDVPQALKQAGLLMVAHWYRSREAVSIETRTPPFELPMAVDSLIGGHRFPLLA